MKVTKIVTLATMYDVERGEQYTKMYIGRLTRRKVENISGKVCVSVDCAKAVVTIPDVIVQKYATIEVINAPAAAAEVVEND